MDGGQTSRGGDRKGELLMGGLVQPASWPTPGAHDAHIGYQKRNCGKSGSQVNVETVARVQLTASGEMPNGSPAETGKRGQLDPALPRWLMGYPEAFDHCSPGWKEWATAQQKLIECSGDPEALWPWLARIALEDCGDTAMG
jgi:hypothetical protein